MKAVFKEIDYSLFSLEFLAAIAGQGGADPELDVVIFQEVDASVPERILVSEAINSEL